ncbi:MAG: hypothetical protein ISR98_01535 [Parcubacteria group bacterium]|nr:hypothetical protein [Parcubacteria group bacterium]
MITTYEEAKELIGERVSVERESVRKVFSVVTNVLSVVEALENPEIRSGAQNGLLCVIGGKREKSETEEAGDLQMYIYPDTKVDKLLKCTDLSF